MSAHTPCTCPDRKKAMAEHWEVTQFMCNHSAFNGYHYTPSRYSHVICTAPGCCGSWRTTAAYVVKLKQRAERAA